MPARIGLRPLQAWRYVGVFCDEVMVSVGTVRIGPARQAFWAVWDRCDGRMWERTTLGRGQVRLSAGRAVVADRALALDLALGEDAGVETVSPTTAAYAWTRKQGGVPVHGTIALGGGPARPLHGRAIIDDTAAYYDRHTAWRWCAGVGTAADGRALAWNLVAGVHDDPAASERTVWIDGVAHEVGPVAFADDLSAVAGLRFTAEAVRERNENRLLIRSRYRQPFGTFSGELPGGPALADGLGVMESHDVWW